MYVCVYISIYIYAYKHIYIYIIVHVRINIYFHVLPRAGDGAGVNGTGINIYFK